MTSIEEYNVDLNGATVTAKSLVGTMHYSYDNKGKAFRKTYVDANGSEQKYLYQYKEDNAIAVKLPTGAISHAKADHLGRRVFDELQLKSGFISRKFNYHEGVVTPTHTENGKLTSAPATKLVKKIEFFDGRTIEYEYDAEERITNVIDSVAGTTEYTYDKLGQLMSEKVNEVTVNAMTYDGYGNIRSKNGNTYAYECDCGWIDKLTSVNGNPIVYDVNGNPTTYLGHSLAWEKGRQLKSFDGNTYTYNNNGIRTSKSVGCVTHTYTLEGTNIIKETWDGNTLVPLYDLEQSVCGIIFNSTEYYFYKNLQGDVIAITNNAGTVVARYTYDAWGVPTITEDTSGCNIANINPFRYRSYYYDPEIGMYYLQSRYYDPSVGRFITRDNVHYIGKNLLCDNLYVYGANNPVCNIDSAGNFAKWLLKSAISFIAPTPDTQPITSPLIPLVRRYIEHIANESYAISSPDIPEQYEYALHIKVHEVAHKNLHSLCYHTCLVIYAKNDVDDDFGATDANLNDIGTNNLWKKDDTSGYKYFTIGAGSTAGPFGTLKSDYNRKKDMNLSIAVYNELVKSLSHDDVKKIVTYHENYKRNNHPMYSFFPVGLGVAYNSNSFARGLFDVSGYNLKDPGHKYNVPGWKAPLKAEYFE